MNWDGSVTEVREGWHLNTSGHINNGNTTKQHQPFALCLFVLNLAVKCITYIGPYCLF